ncbi:hypothetical protein HG530_005222 [Fusarium avenaceum]|nr:hypothetical protein HG530_005222 [Fusarium avenaceum]
MDLDLMAWSAIIDHLIDIISPLCCVVACCRSSLNSDASRLVLLGFGDNNAQNAVLESSRDVVLVDASGEVEAARELAEGTLGEPVLGLVSGLLLTLLGVFVLGDLIAAFVRGGFLLILNGSVVGVLVFLMFLTTLSDSALVFSTLDKGSRWGAGSVGALSLAADEHCLRLGELDVNILLAHAGELAMELVGISSLADIELWLPLAEAGASGTVLSLALARVAIEVVKETEERGKGSIGVVKVAREESHCVCLVDDWVECDLLQDDSVLR